MTIEGEQLDNLHTASILVVDDDPISMTTICHALEQQGHSLNTAESGENALKVVASEHPDIILLDINMPGISGIEVCKYLKADPLTATTPIIFLTGSKDDLTEAFNAGGVDYILKPFNFKELIARVNVHAKIARLMGSLAKSNAALEALTDSLEEKVHQRTQELVLANDKLKSEMEEKLKLREQMEHLSKFDMATSLFNRIAMEEQLELKVLESQMLPESPLFYLFIDIDQLKLINDAFGHTAGDALISGVARLIKNKQQTSDIIARMGGDEFAIIFNQKSLKEAKARALLLQEHIRNMRFPWGKKSLHIDTSMGLVELTADFQDANHIMSVANRLCIKSKAQGGGELLIYENEKEEDNLKQREVRWVPVIQQALDNGSFELYGQGIFSLEQDKPARYEVLVRMQSSGDELIQPGQFIHIAERYHLINQIDKWVFQNAYETLKGLEDEEIQLCINVSGESFHKQSFLQFICDTLKTGDVDGSRFCFEITEQSVLSKIEESKEFISTLREFGCEFALDDFGTGTSSYGFLKDLDVQYVKIDGSFIQHVENEEISHMMVASIYSIAHENNIKVVAEAVEEQSILDTLREIKVEFAQGYLLHQPENLEALLNQK